MVRQLSGLGILPATDLYDEALVPRVRFAVRLVRTGAPLVAVASAVRDGDLSSEFVDDMLLRFNRMVTTSDT